MMTSPADRDALVRGLLIEAQLDPEDDVLLVTLQELHALGQGPAPLPSAELAKVLAPVRGRRRRLGRRGATVVVLIAAASLGTGLSAAASPAVRAGAQHAIEAIVHVIAPPAPLAGRGTGSSGVTGATPSSAHPSSVPTAVPARGATATSRPAASSAPRNAGATHGNAVESTGAHPVPHRTATPPGRAGFPSWTSHGHGATPAATTGTVPRSATAAIAKAASSSR